jgi:hypothetical protein
MLRIVLVTAVAVICLPYRIGVSRKRRDDHRYRDASLKTAIEVEEFLAFWYGRRDNRGRHCFVSQSLTGSPASNGIAAAPPED